MIYYYIEDNFLSKEKNNTGFVKIESINKALNNLATSNLFGIKEYKKAVKKILNIKSKIPIYYDFENLFFNIKDNNKKYYINYHSLLGIAYDTKRAILIFKNGENIIINVNKKTLLANVIKCQKIKIYKEEKRTLL